VNNSGAAFLNGEAGADFIDRIWNETVQDVAAVDPALETFAS